MNSIMTNYQFIEGVKILAKYVPSDYMENSNIIFEHVQIYYYNESWVTDEDDRDALVRLGWFVCEDSWSAFS